jgi:hypothetical protein
VQSIRRHLSFANVFSVIAVFLALGGSAYAFTLGKNSVKSKNIAKGAVKTSDIGNGAVTTAKLKAGTLASILGSGSVGAAQLKDAVVRQGSASVPDGSNFTAADAFCNPGEKAVAGGGRILSSGDDVSMDGSYPIHTGGSVPAAGTAAPFQGWEVAADNIFGLDNPGAISEIAYVVCVQ